MGFSKSKNEVKTKELPLKLALKGFEEDSKTRKHKQKMRT